MEWVKKREKGAERGRVKNPRTENGKGKKDKKISEEGEGKKGKTKRKIGFGR